MGRGRAGNERLPIETAAVVEAPERIPASAHTDDWAVEVDFDARPYFEQASDEDLIALADEDFRNSYPADNVAYFFQATDAQMATLFQHLEETPGVGFECEVDAAAALAWIDAVRPDLREHIDAIRRR